MKTQCKRNSKKFRKHFSPFPSPQTYVRRNYTHSSEYYCSGDQTHRCKLPIIRKYTKRRRRQRIRKQQQLNRNKYYTESPLRRDLRIRNTINNSIRSHIDRLARYRQESMMMNSSSFSLSPVLPPAAQYVKPVNYSVVSF